MQWSAKPFPHADTHLIIKITKFNNYSNVLERVLSLNNVVFYCAYVYLVYLMWSFRYNEKL